MQLTIDINEAIEDSPSFRHSLTESEANIDGLGLRLEKLLKLCSVMVETGRAFNTANGAFICGIKDVAGHFSDESIASKCLSRFTSALTELQKYHSILLEQAQQAIGVRLGLFIKEQILKVRERKKQFDKLSNELDSALMKNAQASRSKVQECEDIKVALQSSRENFKDISVDYVCQLNSLHLKKRFDILDSMLAYVRAQSTYFHQGSDLFEDLDVMARQTSKQLEELLLKVNKDLQASMLTLQPPKSDDAEPEFLQGYLFKRTSNAFKSWVRRWFLIRHNALVYRKRDPDSLVIMEEDLRLCRVRLVTDGERRFCFEVLSPSRTHLLQADSQDDADHWVTAINTAVFQAYRDASSASQESHVDEQLPNAVASHLPNKIVSKQACMEQILSVPGNVLCCDCGNANPRWSSINLGVTLCIECSGIHRSFGVHLSKVRSVTLDSWEPEQLKVMKSLGNDIVNGTYDGEDSDKAVPSSNREQRENWIRRKYIEKKYVKPCGMSQSSSVKRWTVRKKKRSPSKGDSSGVEEIESKETPPDLLVFGLEAADNQSESSFSDVEDDHDTDSLSLSEDLEKLEPNLLLFKAANARNIPVMQLALAQGASVNWQSCQEGKKTPLIKAIESGSICGCEFLLLNGAKVDLKDAAGRSPLHHATSLGHTGQVCQLLKRSANLLSVDEQGLDPIAIAIQTANADIVTLLRLAKLNEEMKECEGIYGGAGDETFNEVFKDFTHMANNDPEKLNRAK